MTLPLVVLAVGSIFIGYIFRDAMIGLGSSFIGESIYQKAQSTDNAIDSEHISTITK